MSRRNSLGLRQRDARAGMRALLIEPRFERHLEHADGVREIRPPYAVGCAWRGAHGRRPGSAARAWAPRCTRDAHMGKRVHGGLEISPGRS